MASDASLLNKTDEKESGLKKAKLPFHFYTRLHLTVLTGLKAANLTELLEHLKEVPGSSIYHHTHRFLQQHQYLNPEPPNDFAYWTTEVLGEKKLGEGISSIDVVQFSTIRDLRNRLIEVISNYVQQNPLSQKKFVNDGEEFYFMKSLSFILPTHDFATDLAEFIEILKKITVDSIYFHVFEARLRLEKKTNDFSAWIEQEFGETDLARKLSNLDPYTHTLEDLRRIIISIVEKRLRRK